MSFQKVGMLKTAKVEILKDVNNWGAIKKQANTFPVEKKSVEKEADFEVVATIDPEKFVYIHTTIMAGVKVEDDGFSITSETEKYINDNHDAWTCEDLLKDYKSFKRATTFVEHDQRLENAKGKCIDVIARDMGDTILIDVLFSVDKRHKDLVANIENGIINAVSMGCSTAQTICSICGNNANDPNSYCDHLKSGNKGRMFKNSNGDLKKAAEICKNNTFFDVSLVANPAFAGAVFRKILSSSEASNHLLANILTSKIEAMYENENYFLKAASKENDIANISIKQDGSIEIKTPNQTFTASEALTKQEIQDISKLIPQKIEQPKTSTILNKFLERIFGEKKEATHPIENDSNKKDFSISDNDYSEIPYRNPHDVLENLNDPAKEITLELNPIVVLKIDNEEKEFVSRVNQFECFKCGFKTELWKIKAASIDSGYQEILECPRCFYVSEESLHSPSNQKEAKKEINDKPKIKLFRASQDIPVENDEGTYWFDEEGNSVITKGEKVSFVTTVENGEYGLFVTETGEDFFMPMEYVNSINN